MFFGAVSAFVLTAVISVFAVSRPLTVVSNLDFSTVLQSAEGEILALRLTQDGYWREAVTLDEIDPGLIDMLIAYEDKRFFGHHGVDLTALLRASLNLVRYQEIGSGASTITMQLARLLYADLRQPGLFTKLKQIFAAIRLDAHLSKDEILELYFALAPYGGNIEGVRAGAQAWFQKTPKQLTLTEQALLVALPQSPEARRPDRNPQAAHHAKNRVITRTAERLALTAADLDAAIRDRAPARIQRPRTIAPHLLDRLSEAGSTKTTIFAEWQSELASLVRDHVHQYPAPTNGGAMIVERTTGAVRAYVGSTNYNDAERLGANNFLASRRSTGSTLKPLIYAKALHLNKITEREVFEDAPITFAGFTPTNFNQTFGGAIPLREALVQSLNIPAIQTLQMLGANAFEAELLSILGDQAPLSSDSGLSLATGGLYLTAENLAALYLAFADPSQGQKLSFTERTVPNEPRFFVSRTARDTTIRLLSQQRANGQTYVAKTGTSHQRQDAWTVMMTSGHIIVTWLGTPDASSTSWLTGRESALPLAQNIATSLGLQPPLIPQTNSPTRSTTIAPDACDQLIVFPTDGALVRSGNSEIQLMASADVEWFINTVAVETGRTIAARLNEGIARVSAKDGNCTETVEFFVDVDSS